jgi:hypothetical protein
MTTLDTQKWLSEEIPSMGLSDEDVGLLKGLDCDILTSVDGDIMAQGFNRINRVLISIRCIFFFRSLSRKKL